MILRECLKHEPLASILLSSSQFYDFFVYVEANTFDISSDAFASFRVLNTFTIGNTYKAQDFGCRVFREQL